MGNDAIRFQHHHPEHLHELIEAHMSARERPLIVTDGWCTHCGKMAPLKAYLDYARAYEGFLIVDDTQALGIWGDAPTPKQPYGVGGGGSLPYLQISGPNIILVSSLTKGFGVPIASISSHQTIIDYFRDVGESRVHCSPPAYADIRAVEHALDINERLGNRLRHKLFCLVRRFNQNLNEMGFRAEGGLFPVQKLSVPNTIEPQWLYSKLIQAGLRTIPIQQQSLGNNALDIVFAFTSNHTIEEIDLATRILRHVLSDFST